MLTVHHLGVSQSERIVWLCEELGLDYRLVRHDRDPVTVLAPAAYKALHPAGTAPVIVDGDTVLGESGAIVDYIIARHGGGRFAVGPEDPHFADYLFWFHFANGSLMPAIMLCFVSDLVGAGDDPRLAALRARADTAFRLIEQRLEASPYLAGDALTAADIMTVVALTTMGVFAPRDLTPYPAIRAYLDGIRARPAYRRAMEKADPGLLGASS